ncbi:MAG: hypothetical protein M1828_003692 [Chrysothrix sp. TS-e1954]|nr:MAG: hypothetical protein M1828_003692 [Chrysothrix sp. TS-e1954]
MSYKSETVWNKARVSREDFLTVANLVVLKHGQTLQERMLEAAKVENDFDRLKNSGLKSAPVDTFFPETIRAAVAVDDQPKVPNGFEENDDDSDSDSEPMSLAYTGGTAHVAGSATSARSTGLRSELAMEHCQREFLDRFAQLASNQKGGNSVVCSAMSRTNGKIIIWLTKNSKFTARELIKLEQKFPERLRLFAEVAQTEGNVGIASSQKRLWEEVVELAQKRILMGSIRARTLKSWRSSPGYEEFVKALAPPR